MCADLVGACWECPPHFPPLKICKACYTAFKNTCSSNGCNSSNLQSYPFWSEYQGFELYPFRTLMPSRSLVQILLLKIFIFFLKRADVEKYIYPVAGVPIKSTCFFFYDQKVKNIFFKLFISVVNDHWKEIDVNYHAKI